MSFTVYDFRDFDLMMKLNDLTGATAGDLAAELGVNGDEGARKIASRLSWMQRFGMIQLDRKDRLWALSRGGERVVESKIRSAMQQELLEIPDEQMIEVMAHVTTRFRVGDPMVGHMLRREFLFGTSPRRR